MGDSEAAELIQRQRRQVGIEILLGMPQLAPSSARSCQAATLTSPCFRICAIPTRRGLPSGCTDARGPKLAGYCQRLVTRDLDQAQRILDSTRQAQVLNKADAQLAKDVPVIPLFDNPTVLAHKTPPERSPHRAIGSVRRRGELVARALSGTHPSRFSRDTQFSPPARASAPPNSP